MHSPKSMAIADDYIQSILDQGVRHMDKSAVESTRVVECSRYGYSPTYVAERQLAMPLRTHIMRGTEESTVFKHQFDKDRLKESIEAYHLFTVALRDWFLQTTTSIDRDKGIDRWPLKFICTLNQKMGMLQVEAVSAHYRHHVNPYRPA